MVSAEHDFPVDRPSVSKDYLAGTAPEAWMPLRPEETWRHLDVSVRLGQRARGASLAERVVELDTSERLRWDRLLIATGAEPVRLSVPGADRPNVYTVRTLAVATVFRERLSLEAEVALEHGDEATLQRLVPAQAR